MLTELRFVQGAVAKKDFLPAMTHFRIEGGHVRSYNGALAMSSPIKIDLDCTPKAVQMVQAIANCPAENPISLTLTKGGRLKVQSGAFQSYVECIDGDTPHVEPAGTHVDIDGEQLLEAIKVLYPFVGEDASRPWANGILFKGSSAYATNNVCLTEYWLGFPVPCVVNIPKAALKEVLRVNEPPTHLQLVEGNSVTFHYSDDRWIRTQLLDTTWPDVDKILNVESKAEPIDPELFVGMDAIKQAADKMGRVYIKDGALRTSLDEMSGSSYSVASLDFEGCYQIQMLNLLKSSITSADFKRYPAPCMFFGPRVRGAIVGILM